MRLKISRAFACFAPADRFHYPPRESARGSVSRVLSVLSDCATIPLRMPLPASSSNQPGRRKRAAPCAVPIRSCSRWGLPCRSCYQHRGALLPHRFALAAPKCGGLFSVALSLKSPWPDVIRHRCSVEPGLSSRPEINLSPAVAQPSGQTALVVASRFGK